VHRHSAKSRRHARLITRLFISPRNLCYRSSSAVMLAPRSLLLASLLTVLQLALSVDAKGGGKGSKGSKGTKGSKGPKKSKTKPKPVKFRDHGKCYDAEYAISPPLISSLSSSLDTRRVQIPCPASKSVGLIVGIVVGVIVGKISARS
jgi:hypothetical protein